MAVGTLLAMSFLVQRRLRSVSSRLQRAREDLAVTNEQLEQLESESDSAHTRAVVSDDRFAAGEYTEAERHASALARHRTETIARIAELEKLTDEVLDKLTEQSRR